VTPVTEVAAGVLLRETEAGAKYLLARRPPDKVYAGYWEFPGGKVEPGETFREALMRELREELGIVVTAATPWLCREFAYPHARVRLKFFRVTGWEGEIEPREHSGVTWTLLHDAPAAAPMLPANAPILRALALPGIYAITNAEENGVDAELARIARAAAHGIRLMQLRDKTLPAAERRRFAGEAAALAAASGFMLLINDDEALAREIGASGVHLPSPRLDALIRRPDLAWAAASCHTAADLALAERLELDFAVLGPVLPTATHPESPGMGWETFARLVERAAIPVFALGGLRPESLAVAEARGAHGIAMLRGW
jgi:8-oxo-dGTP diphosphatase